MKTKALLFMILLVIVSFSCNKDDDPKVDPTDFLVGTWTSSIGGIDIPYLGFTLGRRTLELKFSKNTDGALKGTAYVKHYVDLGWPLGEKMVTEVQGSLKNINLNKNTDCPWNISFNYELVDVITTSYRSSVDNGLLDCNGSSMTATLTDQASFVSQQRNITITKK